MNGDVLHAAYLDFHLVAAVAHQTAHVVAFGGDDALFVLALEQAVGQAACNAAHVASLIGNQDFYVVDTIAHGVAVANIAACVGVVDRIHEIVLSDLQGRTLVGAALQANVGEVACQAANGMLCRDLARRGAFADRRRAVIRLSASNQTANKARTLHVTRVLPLGCRQRKGGVGGDEIQVSDSSLAVAELELRIAMAESKQTEAEEKASAMMRERDAAKEESATLLAEIDELKAVLDAEDQKLTELRAELEKQRFATEQIRKLYDEAERAKELAQAESVRARVELEELKRENVRLVEIARAAEETCAAAEEKSRICEQKLEEQIELYEKEKLRQKNLFAEAARQAKEELDKNAAERAEAEASLAAEESRLEAIRAEAERVRREAELEEQKAKSSENSFKNEIYPTVEICSHRR